MKPRTTHQIQQEQERKTLKLLDAKEKGLAGESRQPRVWLEPTAESTERLRELLLRGGAD